jgi:PAS domain S-box-containing protein
MQHDIDATDTLSALTYCRRMVLQRASTLLDQPQDLPVAEQAEVLPNVSALLMTSLEELKVAEEELRDQADRLAAQQAAMDDAVRHYRSIFQNAPLPVVLTDRYGTIQDVNVAAAGLLRRDAHYLHRKPLAALVTAPSRDKFRVQLAMMTEDRPREWHLELRRNGDVSVDVWATVGFVPEVGPNGSGLLCWMVHPQRVEDQ